jgi:hypothetical protein
MPSLEVREKIGLCLINRDKKIGPRGAHDKEIELVVAGMTQLRHYLCGIAVALEYGGEGKVGKGLAPLRAVFVAISERCFS